MGRANRVLLAPASVRSIRHTRVHRLCSHALRGRAPQDTIFLQTSLLALTSPAALLAGDVVVASCMSCVARRRANSGPGARSSAPASAATSSTASPLECLRSARSSLPFRRSDAPRDIVVSLDAVEAYYEPIVIGQVRSPPATTYGRHRRRRRDTRSARRGVVAKVESVMQTENLVRKAILEGVAPKGAYTPLRKVLRQLPTALTQLILPRAAGEDHVRRRGRPAAPRPCSALPAGL